MPRKRQATSKPPDADTTTLRALSCRYSDGHVLETHEHTWSQLLLAREGVMEVETGGRSWVVPPTRALWIRHGTPHGMRMIGSVAMRTLYLAPGFGESTRRPSDVLPPICVLHVPPLLRELVLYIAARGALDRAKANEARLGDLLIDLFDVAPQAPTDLTLPTDPRALRVATLLAAEPANDHLIIDLARHAGASERTLERLFLQETGLSLGRFRREIRLRHAIRLLASGTPITAVALDVGYDSTSAFITVFRRAFGVTPGAFFSA